LGKPLGQTVELAVGIKEKNEGVDVLESCRLEIYVEQFSSHDYVDDDGAYQELSD